MWLLREFVRLVQRIGIAFLVALVIAEIRALVAAWGRIPGVSTLKRNPEDPSLTPGAVLGGAGIALLAVGLFL